MSGFSLIICQSCAVQSCRASALELVRLSFGRAVCSDGQAGQEASGNQPMARVCRGRGEGGWVRAEPQTSRMPIIPSTYTAALGNLMALARRIQPHVQSTLGGATIRTLEVGGRDKFNLQEFHTLWVLAILLQTLKNEFRGPNEPNAQSPGCPSVFVSYMNYATANRPAGPQEFTPGFAVFVQAGRILPKKHGIPCEERKQSSSSPCHQDLGFWHQEITIGGHHGRHALPNCDLHGAKSPT